MKQIIFILTLLLATSCKASIKEGDIIFQTSSSNQSPLIAFATKSNKTHCGIIVNKNDKWYVLETLRTIKLTPLEKFIDRGVFNKYWIKKCPKNNVKINYEQYLNKRYDSAFKPNNDIYYCSELVYRIYETQLGIKLCDLKPIKEYNLYGLKDVIKKRGMNLNQLVVAPSDLYKSKIFK